MLDSGWGVADVLPAIVRAIRDDPRGKNVQITADGGVRTGFDVVKTIALGADAVLVGRPLARVAVAEGAPGVKRVLGYLKNDIRSAMILTSCNSVSDIGEELLVQSADPSR